jgi:hypothetical protein
MSEDEVGGRGGSSAHHVLIAAADVGRYDLEDDAVVTFAADVALVHARAVLEN